eukprot:4821131-Pleurochrysis_carterae.AAC.1
MVAKADCQDFLPFPAEPLFLLSARGFLLRRLALPWTRPHEVLTRPVRRVVRTGGRAAGGAPHGRRLHPPPRLLPQGERMVPPCGCTERCARWQGLRLPRHVPLRSWQ